MTTKKKPAGETPALRGFELAPPEGFRITMRWERGGKLHELTHLFARGLNRGERITLTRAAAQQTIKDDTLSLQSDETEQAYANAWEHMIQAVEGYTLNGQPADMEAVRERIPIEHKRAAIDATNQVSIYELIGGEDEQGFGLDSNDLEAALEALQGGDPVMILFVFRERISDADLRKIKSEANRIKLAGRKGFKLGGGSALFVIEEVFDRYVESVSGYLLGGKPLMESADWRDLVPIDHKALVINSLRNRQAGINKD